MYRILGSELATWYIGDDADEAHGYRMAGAKQVVRAGSLMKARNMALNDALQAGLPCVQLSDDLRKLEIAISKDNKDNSPISVQAASHAILQSMKDIGAHYGGCAPTANAFYFNPHKRLTTNAFIVGDFTVYDASATNGSGKLLRFDEEMTLKEDYDFTCQHLESYGVVARCNNILATFSHRTNSGGAVSYRTSAEEQKNISILRNKWGDVIRPNPKRENEVLLRWPTNNPEDIDE
tara:strand:- start:1854 stop:2561 length:708 start_codon:yes stop_codon:yes gene_type:complete